MNYSKKAWAHLKQCAIDISSAGDGIYDSSKEMIQIVNEHEDGPAPADKIQDLLYDIEAAISEIQDSMEEIKQLLGI